MAGAVDHLVVLDTERTYHRNLDDWYNVRMERYRALVNLFSALGGGVPAGISLPGDGVRPAPLTAEIDYGAILSGTVPKPNAPASDAPQAQSPTAGANAGVKAAEASTSGQAPQDSLPSNEHVDVVLTATLPSRARIAGVDWDAEPLREEGEGWLVEMSGVYDRAAVTAAWRDLRDRFPKQTESLSLLPRSQGRVVEADDERASWYRLFIAKLPDRQMADALCAALRAGQQRCSVVASREIAEEDGFSASSPLKEMAAHKPANAGDKGRQP